MICIDTNILIYAHRAGAPEHRAARRAIERAASASIAWGISQPSLAEFWTQVTHPRYPGGPSQPKQAAGFLTALIEGGRARVFLPRRDFPLRLLELARELRIAGPRVFDVQIALIARDAGARRLWTHDTGFVPVSGLLIEDPLG